MNRFVVTFSLILCAVPVAPAQMEDYLDVYAVKVNPERRADFDAVCTRIADANRKAKGDAWLAMQNEYGEGNTVFFISIRKNYAAIEEASTAFMRAIKEAYGPGGWKKMMQDFNSTIVSSRAELRRRRWDLSANAPKTPEASARLIGEARWLRTLVVQVRPGRQAQFEDRAKAVKAVFEKGSPSWTVLVSQTIAGGPGINYHFTSPQPSLAAFDEMPDLRKLMGEKEFIEWQKDSGETVLSSEVRYMRFLPELSNAPAEIAKVSLDFWRPMPASAIKPKAKAVEAAKANQ